ncbi:fimbrial protein [Escherichia coli]|uniref:fimbrial protein n=1 Tax=Escherichia coli TaxID=562 RepID=UPI0012DEEB4B|nr:fimbrial protein [Escherichia coli]MUN34670.1 fimbrial protein [Escherichia coli]
MKNRMRLILSALTGGVMLLSASVMAVDVPIKITGTIYIPPCKIKNDTDFKVSFGKIALQKVDGQNYAQPTTVEVSCEYFQGKPYIRLSGGTGQLSGAPDNVLNTTGANPSALGIALYQGASVDLQNPLRLGGGEQGKYGYEIRKGLSAVNIKNSQFTFTAVPYKHGNAELKAGGFDASVTMSISYL